MQILGILLMVLGGIGGLVGGFWLLLVAFQKSWQWGLGCLLLPFLSVIFAIMHWDKAGRPFMIQLVCIIPFFAGSFLAGPQIGFGNQDQIRRYSAPKQPKSNMPIPPPTAVPSANVRLAYDVPQSWKELAAGGMRKAAFEVEDGDNKAEITIISFPGTAGGLLENINRWRGQIGLPDTNEQELIAAAAKVSIGGTEGLVVELVGPDSMPKPETILGAIVMHGGSVWFIKLKGPSALAAREKSAFEAFVRSIKFSSSDGA